MQKTRSTGQKYLLSALTLALLSACGGGNGDFINAEDGGSFLGSGNAGLKPVPNTDGPAGTLLVNDAIEGSDKTLSQRGQQNSPSVALIDEDHSASYNPNRDVVRFDQVSYISSVCLFGECGAPAGSLKKDIEAEIARLNRQKESLSASGAGGNAGGNAGGANPNQALIGAIEERIAALQSSIPADELYAIVSVDSSVEGISGLTVDSGLAANSKLGGIQMDAGIVKIDKERIDGKLVTRGGTIDRRFNGIHPIYSLDPQANKALLPAYLRQAVSGGWSYQTFARYFSTPQIRVLQSNRDLLQGYQSVGQPTVDMPKSGWADYKGIAHGLYNGNQVTMENMIHADFAKRELEYKTSSAPYLHTFEKNAAGKIEHIVEQRPDMALSGNAGWDKSKADFVGDIHAANGAKGVLQGRFYGPQAVEIGGIFGIDDTVNGERVQYIGGFGGKR